MNAAFTPAMQQLMANQNLLIVPVLKMTSS